MKDKYEINKRLEEGESATKLSNERVLHDRSSMGQCKRAEVEKSVE